jgi:prevent-host-death family protein
MLVASAAGFRGPVLEKIGVLTRLIKLSSTMTPMKTVNIHEAKTQLSKLIEEASKGESFVIAKAGKPLVKVTALLAPTGAQVRRLGFMVGLSRQARNLIELWCTDYKGELLLGIVRLP